MQYIEVEEAIARPGMRLVLTAGVPGPWGEAAKALVNYKRLDWAAVRQEAAGVNEHLKQWTGQTSAPVMVYEDLPPACNWLDQTALLDRIVPTRPLLPLEPSARAAAIGLAGLIAGPGGFGWQRRLSMIAPMLGMDSVSDQVQGFAARYGFSPDALEKSMVEFVSISRFLDHTLGAQEQGGSPFFIGDAVTAVDFYWACFAGMVSPLPREVNPMPGWAWNIYQAKEPEVVECMTPRLLAHRDMMYQQYIALPLDF